MAGTAEDEILIRLGLDATKFHHQLSAIPGQVKSKHGKAIESGFEEAGEKAQHAFAHGFGGRMLARAGIFAAIIVMAEKLKETLKSLWSTGDNESGPGWIRKLGELWNSPDSLKEAFKESKELDKKLKEFNKEAKKHKKEELEAEEKIQKLWLERQNLQTKLVHHVNEEAKIRKELDKFHGSTVERLKIIEKLEEARNNVAEDRKKIEEDWQKKRKDAEKEEEEAIKRQQTLDERRVQLAKVIREIGEKEGDSVRSKAKQNEQYMPSIQDLAGSGHWIRHGTKFQSGPFARDAQRIQFLENQAKLQYEYGNTKGAEASINERTNIYNSLAKVGIIPDTATDIAKSMREMKDNISDLVNQRKVIEAKIRNGE